MLYAVGDYKMMFRIKHPRKNQKNTINILYLQTFMYIVSAKIRKYIISILYTTYYVHK